MTREEKSLHVHALTMDNQYLRRWLDNRKYLLQIAVMPAHKATLTGEILEIKSRLDNQQKIINILTRELSVMKSDHKQSV